MREPRILLLDEPTSALAEREVEWLFGLVRRLRDDGACVLFTSHRWGEVGSLADRITILRNGTHVATERQFAEHEAVTLMTGRTIDRMYPDRPALPDAESEVALSAEGLEGDVLSGVSFDLKRGEILGIGGLAGQGQPELFLSLFGARKALARADLDRRQAGEASKPGRRDQARPCDRARPGGPEDRGTDAADVREGQPHARRAREDQHGRSGAPSARDVARRGCGRATPDQDPQRRDCSRSGPSQGAISRKS